MIAEAINQIVIVVLVKLQLCAVIDLQARLITDLFYATVAFQKSIQFIAGRVPVYPCIRESGCLVMIRNSDSRVTVGQVPREIEQRRD